MRWWHFNDIWIMIMPLLLTIINCHSLLLLSYLKMCSIVFANANTIATHFYQPSNRYSQALETCLLLLTKHSIKIIFEVENPVKCLNRASNFRKITQIFRAHANSVANSKHIRERWKCVSCSLFSANLTICIYSMQWNVSIHCTRTKDSSWSHMTDF